MSAEHDLPVRSTELDDIRHEIALLGERDPEFVRHYHAVGKFLLEKYFGVEIRGTANIPSDGGVLLVGNHSGGALTTDLMLLLEAFSQEFGNLEKRPLYPLVHKMAINMPGGSLFRRGGSIEATPENARTVLGAGMATVVFPGGDRDAARPFWKSKKIDFKGRTGYVRTAMDAGVPIVPFVTLGAQEAQLFLPNEWLVKALQLKKLGAGSAIPLTLGFPFGVGVGSLPMPVKHRLQILEPIDLAAEVGDDVEAGDRLVRARMQEALDVLAGERRFPLFF